MSLVLAAHALGYAANWITEWYAYDRGVLAALGLNDNERIAGFVHIGRPSEPPEDRPRPPPRPNRDPLHPPISALACPPARLRAPQVNMFYEPQRTTTAFRAIPSRRSSHPADRLDHLDERERRDQSRALLILQRGFPTLRRSCCSPARPKDSLVFVEETREFVCNLATFDLRTARGGDLGAVSARRE